MAEIKTPAAPAPVPQKGIKQEKAVRQTKEDKSATQRETK